MAANTSPIFVKNITGKGTTWTNSDAANTKKTIAPTIGSEGARLGPIIATSTDTVSRDWLFYLNDGSTDFLIGTLSIVAGSGTGGIPAVSVLSQAVNFPFVSSDGSILVPTGWTLKAENATQVTSAKTVTFTVAGADY